MRDYKVIISLGLIITQKALEEESKLKRLTTLTGATGSGKTTFLSQYSLDFAMKGLSTLFCSFELKNEVLLTTMLKQFSGVDLEENPQQFDYWADQFEKLPIYFQSFFGSTEPQQIISLIDFCVYNYDVGHVILDNLQFMLSGQGRGFERFEIQDNLISQIRKIATEKNIHISVVIHPRKTDDNLDLHVSSVYGTSKSTQESDNIIILQNRSKYKMVDIKKNRFDGEIGKAPMIFCKQTKRFYGINSQDVQQIQEGFPYQEILKNKKQNFKEYSQIQKIEIQQKEDFFDFVRQKKMNEENVQLEETLLKQKQQQTKSELLKNDQTTQLENENSNNENNCQEYQQKNKIINNKEEINLIEKNQKKSEKIDYLKELFQDDNDSLFEDANLNSIQQWELDNNQEPQFNSENEQKLDYSEIKKIINGKPTFQNRIVRKDEYGEKINIYNASKDILEDEYLDNLKEED